MRRPFRLVVGDPVSHDTVKCTREMLTTAEAGKLYGFANVAMYKGREFKFHIVGECARNPTFARALVLDLLDELRKLRDRNGNS